jgi:RNA polymerase sigma-70 factor, ECF subfamily
VPLSAQSIEAAYLAGAVAHSGLELARPAFAAFADEREATWQGDLARAPDLYLACACANGVPGAAERFVALFGDRIESYLGTLATSHDRVDEVRQIVLVRCLVATEEGPPAIAAFSGRGSLEGWVRATAVREALGLERAGKRTLQACTPDTGVVPPWSLAEHYREPALRAFIVATRTLAPSHRALLRLHYVHGTTTAQLATMFQVSRATLVRRLTDAREALLEKFSHALGELAGLAPEDGVKVLRMVRSQIDLSLSSLLRDSSG